MQWGKRSKFSNICRYSVVGVRDFESRQSEARFNKVNRTVSPLTLFAVISSCPLRTREYFFDRHLRTVFAVGLLVFGGSINFHEHYVLPKKKLMTIPVTKSENRSGKGAAGDPDGRIYISGSSENFFLVVFGRVFAGPEDDLGVPTSLDVKVAARRVIMPRKSGEFFFKAFLLVNG